MLSLQDVRDAIANTLADEKAYVLPTVCFRFGLEPGDESEAFSSKRSYILKRLGAKDKDFLLEMGKKVLIEYPSSHLGRILSSFFPDGGFGITNVTRKNIMDELLLLCNISGKMDIVDFLKRTWSLDNMPSMEHRFTTATDDICQHMINNDDWSFEYLFDNYLGLMHSADDKFLYFLEQVVHPIVREQGEQEKYVTIINKYLNMDGYKLEVVDQISGFPLFRSVKTEGGVKGEFKNLIFSADGPKPEIVLSDSINNEILIVKNAEYCLVYNKPIPQTGLLWSDLVAWWACLNDINIDIITERSFYNRLFRSLDSVPEKLLFSTYFKVFKNLMGDKMPALIPQVYLHYDPYTVRELKGKRRIPRQRMDFLILFSSRERIIIEVDGKQHYSDDNNKADVAKYSEMVAADRLLKLNGYDVYRFGGYELQGESGKEIVKSFFERLFIKHHSL